MIDAGQPNNPEPTGDLQDLVTYMFRDPVWVSKVVLGAVLALIPILNFVVYGYALRVINNVRNSREPVMPAWGGDFGKLWTEGLMLVIINFVYLIPLLLVNMILGGIAAAAASSQSGGGSAVATVFGILIVLFDLVYGVAMLFWLQGAFINYAVEEKLAAGFDIQRIRAIVMGNLGRLLLTVGIAIGLAIVISVISVLVGWIPCLGQLLVLALSFLSVFYILLVMAYNCGIVALRA
jgi:hypothetical protein